jgi:hypothetical protein
LENFEHIAIINVPDAATFQKNQYRLLFVSLPLFIDLSARFSLNRSTIRGLRRKKTAPADYQDYNADERSRTSTPIREQAPEACASANSATSASFICVPLREAQGRFYAEDRCN